MQIEIIEDVKASPADSAIAVVNTSVAELNALEAGFADLEKRYSGVVYAVDTTAGMADAKAARVEIRDVRYKAQNIIKATKAALNTAKAELEDEGEKVVARVAAIEDPIDKQIKAHEEKKAIEKAAAEQAKREADEKISVNIALLAFNPLLAIKASADIDLEISRIEGIVVTLDEFGDRSGEAAQTRATTLESLRALYASKKEQELAQATLKAEQDRIAEQQRQLDAERAAFAEQQRAALAAEAAAAAARQAEADRIAADKRAAEDKARAEAQAAEDAARKQEQARLDKESADRRAEALAVAAAHDARVAAERADLEAAQAALAAKVKRLHDAAPALLAGLKWALSEITTETYEWASDEQVEAHGAAIDAVKQAEGEEV